MHQYHLLRTEYEYRYFFLVLTDTFIIFFYVVVVFQAQHSETNECKPLKTLVTPLLGSCLSLLVSFVFWLVFFGAIFDEVV